jgi:dynein heavy chain
MRDVSKVFQGIYLADARFYEGKDNIVKLWSHELLRVFSDRLNSYEDKDLFKSHVNDQLQAVFQLNYEENCTTNGQDAIFVDFLNDQADVYVEVEDFGKLRTTLNEKLEAYNKLPKEISMDLVLFKDAITHVCKIYRVLQMKAGHAFLVGVGGSGRHSLTRLAAYVKEMNVSQIEITKGFNLKSFRECIKEMYQLAGFAGRTTLQTVFIFSDNDVVYETFLEDIQNMLNGGVVPNIYTADEMAQLRDALRRPYKRMVGGVETAENLDAFFFGNIKDNMHLSICFSPIGQAFKDYCKQYPALINNTTIDWFMSWPEEALYEVAKKFLD